jgi:hypothetical protein
LRSRPFAWSGRRRIDGAIRCRQLRAITFRCTTGPTPFQRRGCGQLAVFLGPWSAFTEPCRPSDVPLSLGGTPDQLSSAGFIPPLPTDALSVTRSSRMVSRRIDLRARGPRVAQPVRVERAKAREHLSSYPELASRNPRTALVRTFNRLHSCAYRFAFSLLVPCVRQCFELPSG